MPFDRLEGYGAALTLQGTGELVPDGRILRDGLRPFP